jgi:TPP-dependent pyruvate/acetoin dehydrogenase alpha subunit
MQHARAGHGPVLLEMNVPYSTPGAFYLDLENQNDPLLRCQQYMKEQGMWDDEWAKQLHERLKNEVEQALQDALRDVS